MSQEVKPAGDGINVMELAGKTLENITQTDLNILYRFPENMLFEVIRIAADMSPPNKDMVAAAGGIAIARRWAGNGDWSSLQAGVVSAFPAFYKG